MTRPLTTHPHGTYLRYNAGCRCDRCREAKREQSTKEREQRRGTAPENIPHGVVGYNHYGCRCDRCREANRERVARDIARRSDSPADQIPHGADGYTNYGCRCEVCTAAKYTQTADYLRSAQEESLAGAKRRGEEWSGPELEIAARKDLTAKQVAAMLGRSLSGVRNIRYRLSREPQLQQLAGLAADTAKD